MSDYHPAMPHGAIQEVFPDVFFVTGTMRAEFFGSMWQFNRNMTIVRENGRLTLINTVRLDDAGLPSWRSWAPSPTSSASATCTASTIDSTSIATARSSGRWRGWASVT